MLIQAITEVSGVEWQVANVIHDIAKELKAKEIVVVESMPPHQKQKTNIYYYSEHIKIKKIQPLEEGIVMGATAALLLKTKDIPIICFFAEAHSQLPDSEAAAKVVEALDDYLKLDVNFKPLQDAAKKFEQDLKHFIQKTKERALPQQQTSMKKDLSYIG